MNWRKRCTGLSRDGRTNRWDITCPCGHRWHPPTTLHAHQDLTCPKCRAETRVDYNGSDEWAQQEGK